jgi:putative membrane protein
LQYSGTPVDVPEIAALGRTTAAHWGADDGRVDINLDVEGRDVHVYWGGFGFWWLFPLISAALWITTIVLVTWRVRWWRGGQHWGTPDAASVLRERFARGEIDIDEYQRRLRVLEGR